MSLLFVIYCYDRLYVCTYIMCICTYLHTGNCPLLRNINLLSVYQYSIDINGTINADIYCDFENQSYSLECEANTTHVCKSGASTYSSKLLNNKLYENTS